MSSPNTPAGKTVLVVEDHPVSGGTLVALLAREGYRAVLAENGREALEYLQSGAKPDLILLDMMMPVMDGRRFLEELKRGPGVTVPVVIATAADIGRDWAEAHGCAGFVRKPIDPPLLLEELRRCS